MKTMHVKIENNRIIPLDDTIYLEDKESLKIVIDTELNGELFYTINNQNFKIQDKFFILTNNQIMDGLNLKITHTSTNNIYPTIYILESLKVNDLKLIGLKLDERYPQIIKDLCDNNKTIIDKFNTLAKAFIELNNEVKELRKDVKELRKDVKESGVIL